LLVLLVLLVLVPVLVPDSMLLPREAALPYTIYTYPAKKSP
jgi:hypothetical protein